MNTLSEFETLDAALSGKSISRFGDGEFKIATGGDAVSQRFDVGLQSRLKTILRHAENEAALVCLPTPHPKSPKRELWDRFARSPFRDLCNQNATYGSSFITRPDSAPWIDTPDYWNRLAQLWKGREVVLVRGSGKGFQKSELEADGCHVEEIIAPRQHAFSESAALFARLKGEKRRVIMNLGATATVLCWFLAVDSGVHALDLGHVSMMMRRRGLLGKAAA